MYIHPYILGLLTPIVALLVMVVVSAVFNAFKKNK